MPQTLIAQITGILKDIYPPAVVDKMVLTRAPFLGAVNKITKFSGEHVKVPVVFDDGGGRSATFVTAQALTRAPGNVAYMLTRGHDYSILQIDAEAIVAAADDMGSFINGKQLEIDSKFRAATKSLSRSLFRDGTGYCGVIIAVAVVGADDFTVSTADGVHFNVGDSLWISIGAASTNAVHNAAGTAIAGTVTAVDYNFTANTALITMTAGDIAAIGAGGGAVAAGEFVFQAGDRQVLAITLHTQKILPQGLEGWLNPTAGTLAATVPFFTVNRAVNSQLGGVLDAAAYATVRQAIETLSGTVYAMGGAPDLCIINPRQFIRLQGELSGATQYNKVGSTSSATGLKAALSYKSIVIDGPTGPIDVMADMGCQGRSAYMLTSSTWALRSAGGAPRILDFDGMSLRAMGAADAYELRVGLYGNLQCNAPGFNGLATALPAL